MAAVLILSATINAGLASTAPNRTAQFESQLAMSQLMNVNTPAQFNNASLALKRIIDQGVCNAALFYNYGTTLLLAEHPQEALNALIRSERYSGTTWELRRNMLLATDQLEEDFTAPRLPWYRIPLFWHYGLPGRTRMTIAALAFLLLWPAGLLRKTRYKDTYRIIFGAALTLLILFGSSAATTIYQENHIHQTTVISDE